MHKIYGKLKYTNFNNIKYKHHIPIDINSIFLQIYQIKNFLFEFILIYKK